VKAGGKQDKLGLSSAFTLVKYQLGLFGPDNGGDIYIYIIV
jgi:hypothetical protein